MHWFWRAATAAGIGFAVSAMLMQVLARVLPPSVFAGIYFRLLLSAVGLSVPVAVCGLLTHRFGPKPFDPETRYRTCSYILWG